MAHGTFIQREAAGILVGIILGTVVAWLAMDAAFESWVVQAQSRHNVQMEEDARQWARQDATRKMAVHEETLRREQRHLREWEAAVGGPARAVAKNPDLSLEEMLQQAAEVCAAAGTVVTVRVDRFTDFMVNLDFPQPVPVPQIAAAAACLLQVGAPYLHSVRFFHKGRFLAEVERRGIEALPDWSTASAALVEPLLLWPETEPATLPAVAVSPREESEPVGDFKRLRDVERALEALHKQQMEALKTLIKAQSDAVNLADVRVDAGFQSKSQRQQQFGTGLQSRMQQLRQAGAGLDALRDAFLGREASHKQLLTEQNLDPLAVRIFVRESAVRYRTEREHVTRVFQALAASQSAADYFLNEMQQQWGSWRVLPEAGKIAFTTVPAKEAHDRGTAEWERCVAVADEVVKAWTAWNRAQTATK